jgi:uncharacterized RDD family membrane protein YckC
MSGDHIVVQDQTQGQIQKQTEDQIKVDTPEQIALEFPLAGIGSRFMAIALDTLLQGLLYIVGIFVLIAAAKYAHTLPGSLSWVPASWVPALVVLFIFCIYWGYFATFEILWKGRTPGKRAAGIRVIKDSGRALNVYEVIGRNLMRAVDALPTLYIVGIVTMMISKKNQRLGDYLVGSIVVHDKPGDEIHPDWSSATEAAFPSSELSKMTPEELVLIETYLHRRSSLADGHRDATAYKIASRITAKTGIEPAPGQSLDEFLENIAKQTRDVARFR